MKTKRLTKLGLRLATVALLCAHPALAVSESSDSPARLDGKWELDWNRSESMAPVMEALEVSWLLRQLAGAARVRLELRASPAECEGCAQTIQAVQSTPLSTDEVQIFLDGKPRPGKDPQGRVTVDRYTWSPERGLETIREFELPSGSQARLHDTRNLGDRSDDIVSVLKVWVDGTERASVRRTFRRVVD